MGDLGHVRLLQALLQGRDAEVRRLSEPGAVDPAAFVEQCNESDVAAWVHRLLTAPDRAETLGPEVIEPLARRRRKVQRDNLLLLARAEEGLDLLLRAGVVPLALKGLDFLHRIYGRFDERTLDDVDLLVRPSELTRALEALEGGGWKVPDDGKATHYIRSSHHLPLSSPGEVPVDFELHWNLAQEERFTVDVEALFQRAVEIQVSGRTILRLADRDAVAHLLLHHFTHYFDRRLKWAVDLRLLSDRESFDWDAVGETARSWGASTVSAFALAHLAKTVPDWIPDPAPAGLEIPLWRRALTAPLVSGHPLDLFRNTRSRRVQLYLAAAMLEDPSLLPRWLLLRAVRDRRRSDNPLDEASGYKGGN